MSQNPENKYIILTINHKNNDFLATLKYFLGILSNKWKMHLISFVTLILSYLYLEIKNESFFYLTLAAYIGEIISTEQRGQLFSLPLKVIPINWFLRGIGIDKISTQTSSSNHFYHQHIKRFFQHDLFNLRVKFLIAIIQFLSGVGVIYQKYWKVPISP